MSVYISEEIIEKIGERANIVDIISEYVPLKKTGRNYKALCPFHEERTPSFIVSPEKQLFHCFGCGVGGNVFSFIMKWEKVSFSEAVRILGEKMGISIATSPDEEEEGVSRRELYQINETVLSFFQKSLQKSRVVQDYLEKRGIKEDTLNLFRIGYAPSSADFIEFCKEKGLSFENLERLKLLLPSQKREGYYAYFRERVIFPIFTPEGKVCGFGGRVLDNHSLPKYLNSSQSSLFDKGRNLYGLNFTKRFIEKERSAILVEGYTDLIFLYQAGIRNVVASLGTSLTPSQVRLLKRYTDRIFIAYDQDKAGVEATLRGIDLLLEADLEIKIIDLPEGMDPAEVIEKKGKDFFRERVKEAKEYFDWRIELEIRRRSSLDTQNKIEIVNNLFATLSKVKSLIRVKELIGEMSRWLNLNESLLEVEFEKFKEKERISIAPEFFKKEEARIEREKMLLHLMLKDEEILRMVEEKWGTENFLNSSYRKIAEEASFLMKEKEFSISGLINRLKDERLSSIISSFYLKDAFFESAERKELALDIIKSLERSKRKRKIEELREQIAKSEAVGEEEKTNKLLTELIFLKKQNLLR
ncbi:DNA primase [Candidatus Aerophobetes bacterium]|nr:DNA primase [Candidatus Aerophobetes bacterium]